MYLIKTMVLFFVLNIFSGEITTWTGPQKKYEIYFDNELNVYLSIECQQRRCKAKDFVNIAKTMHFEKEDITDTVNPGSPICKYLKGKIVILRNERSSEVAFCEAHDGTLVELSGFKR